MTVVAQSGTLRTVYHPEAVIGVTPLKQYLLPFPGGRLQALNISFDPRNNEWFDMQAPAYADYPTIGRTGKNRGMNWNSQCAFCHMTNLQKGIQCEDGHL